MFGDDPELAPGDQLARLKVTLLDSDPPVWRRLLVPATIRLDRLDRLIQAAMGWTNSHPHMFVHSSGRYGVPDPDSRCRTNAAPPCVIWSPDLVGGRAESFTDPRRVRRQERLPIRAGGVTPVLVGGGFGLGHRPGSPARAATSAPRTVDSALASNARTRSGIR